MIRALLALLLLGGSAAAQFSNAKKLQGIPICAPLTKTDGFVIAYDSTAACFTSEAAASGSAAFDDITGGTNTTAAMIVGTGASLDVSGSGTINATSLGGTAAASFVTGAGNLTTTGAMPYVSASGVLSESPLLRTGADLLEQRNGANAQSHYIYNTYTDANTWEAMKLEWSSNVARIFIDKGASGGSVRDFVIRAHNSDVATFNNNGITANVFRGTSSGYFSWQSRSSLTSPANGNIRLANAAENDFSCLQFGGTSSSYPCLKRSTTGLAVRLADDSADSFITASLATLSGSAFAALGTPSDGTVQYCSDCTKATPCASGGSGAFAKRINGAWDCD